MIKARVIVPLNVRTGKPEILPDNNAGDRYFEVGDTIEISEAVIGERYKNSSIWYKLTDGSFVWGGGVTDATELHLKIPSNEYPYWMVNLKIPEIWDYSKGDGVGIGIIDTGINLSNEDINFDKSRFYLYDYSKSLQDFFGHGTHCSGLISAGNNKGKFIGVAPASQLFICKFSEKGALSDNEIIRYADAINWCADNEKVHIISISWGGRMKNEEVRKQVEEAVNKATAKNKVVVCSIGDASIDNDPSERFPACFTNSIAIGSIPVQGKLYSYINKHLATMVDGLDISSYRPDNNHLITMSGTSQSNAIVAGIIALIIKKLNFNYKSQDIKSLLVNLSETRQILGKALPCLSGDKLLNFFKS
jgi:subtilisin family serine protease